MADLRREWRGAVPLLLALLVYAPGLGNGFVGYDDWWLVHSPKYGAAFTPAGAKEILADFSEEARMKYGGEYLPVRDLSAAAQYRMFGERPLPYRIVALALFCLCALLLMDLLGRLGASPDRACLAVLFFVSHPLHVEVVAWLSAHKDLLSLLFLLLTLRAYAGGRWKSAMLFFLLGLGSKYQVMLTPLFLPFVDRALGRPLSVKRLAAFGLASGLAYLAAHRVSAVVQYGHMYLGRNPGALLLNLPVVYNEVFSRYLVPLRLHLLYPYEAAAGWGDVRIWAGSAAIAGLLVLGVLAWRKRSFTLVAPPFILLGALPMFRAPEMHFLADRYLLIPSLGFCLLAACGVARIPLAAARVTLLCAAVGGFSILTVHQNAVWRDTATLWRHAAAGEEPLRPMIRRLWAAAERDRGNAALAAGRWAEAEEALAAAARLAPQSPDLLFNLIRLQIELGKRESAHRNFRAVRREAPDDPRARILEKYFSGSRP